MKNASDIYFIWNLDTFKTTELMGVLVINDHKTIKY